MGGNFGQRAMIGAISRVYIERLGWAFSGGIDERSGSVHAAMRRGDYGGAVDAGSDWGPG